MKFQLLLFFVLGTILIACNAPHPTKPNASSEKTWNEKTLKQRALANLEQSKWNKKLFKQDVETHLRFAEIFDAYPLNNYPFPVADYDYAVYSNPLTIKHNGSVLTGIQIGEYPDPSSDSVSTKMVLFVLTNDTACEPESFIDSRNYPYLTAEGMFALPAQTYEWVFQATPDGYSSLFFSMKLFDLRFGQTIIIYPQKDKSFLYEQLDISVDDFPSIEVYKKKIAQNKRHLNRLKESD